uniref:Methyltransferase domain-containing protein n=1 Tax=Candidatus Kentrum sp. FW TaxID=2126338 RepID=A0A450U1R4_9GAMM|nr:MAG: Methyltransferase domain-containing protein [Candidatus Kentron sp. FW]
MSEFILLVNLHKDGERQGPGDKAQTRLAMSISGLLNKPRTLKIADIGCGTGASTLILAEDLDANITAIDLFPEFLSILRKRAEYAGLANKIRTLSCSMDDLPFEENSLDAIWSEGAIYNIGFKKGVSYFKRFLKRGGVLAVSELTWLTSERPDDITAYWEKEYPEVGTASEKIGILEEQGFVLLGYFPLPVNCWLENYYIPLEKRFPCFLAEHDGDDAQSIVDAEASEMDLYKKYSDYYSYGFYIARKH